MREGRGVVVSPFVSSCLKILAEVMNFEGRYRETRHGGGFGSGSASGEVTEAEGAFVVSTKVKG